MLEAFACCPNCAAARLKWSASSVNCGECGAAFRREGAFVDFVNPARLGATESTAIEIWGGDLHSGPLSAPPHFEQLRSQFPDTWRESSRGLVLEIGCGSGTDAVQLSKEFEGISLLAFDIGENVESLSKQFGQTGNVCFFRANAMRIPLRDDVAEMIYSFGVLHHTPDPPACFAEAHRVLAPGARFFFYVYSAHEENVFKAAGVLAETSLMRLIRFMPRALRVPFLYLVSLPCLAAFSWPARLMRLLGMSSLASKFPMHWGSTPGSIIPDLKDRLFSPVNYRFRKSELMALLEKTGFREIRLHRTAAGLFGCCSK